MLISFLLARYREYVMESDGLRYLHMSCFCIRNRRSERSEQVRFLIQKQQVGNYHTKHFTRILSLHHLAHRTRVPICYSNQETMCLLPSWISERRHLKSEHATCWRYKICHGIFSISYWNGSRKAKNKYTIRWGVGISFTRWLRGVKLTWDQGLFSFRFENYIPAGKTKWKESLIQTFNEMSAAHLFDWLTFAKSANQNYFHCLFF